MCTFLVLLYTRKFDALNCFILKSNNLVPRLLFSFYILQIHRCSGGKIYKVYCRFSKSINLLNKICGEEPLKTENKYQLSRTPVY